MEFFLTSFGLHNPYVYATLPEHGIYPISDSSGDSIDLDYTSLLVGRKYYIAEKAFDYVTAGEKSFLAPMANSLRFLKREGFLETIDVETIVNKSRDVLVRKVEDLAQTPEVWIDVMREQWGIVRAEYIEFHRKFGHPDNELLNTAHFPVLNYLSSIGEEDNYDKMARITRLLESRKRRFSPKEQDYIKEISKPLLAQILINDLARTEMNVPILDWEDNEFYYSQLQMYRWDRPYAEITLISEAKRLFDCVVPSLKPKNIESVVRFISNERAVRSLRDELWRCIENEGELTEKWYKQFIDEIFSHQLNVKRKMKKFRWLGSVISTLVPGAGIIQEAVMEIGQNVTEDEIEKRSGGNYEWFYTLQSEVDSKEENSN